LKLKELPIKSKSQLKDNRVLKLTLIGSVLASFLVAACAQGDVSNTDKPTEAKQISAEKSVSYGPPIEFRGTLSGDVLDMTPFEGEVVTDQAKQFKATGENPYSGNSEAIKRGYTIFSTACSGCHGHLAEGKLGPALADSYWTYPKNETDKGMFETVYGGAAGMMGPQQGRLSVDEILHVIAWIRFQHDENAKGVQSH
jgi:cytochrome c-L